MYYKVFESLEYALKCPVAGQWHLRPGKYKCSATQYVCLLYLPDNIYHETCDGLDYSSRGNDNLTVIMNMIIGNLTM